MKFVLSNLPSVTLERHLHHQEDICQALHSQAHWTVTHIGASGFFQGVVVSINHLVEILRDHLTTRGWSPRESPTFVFQFSLTLGVKAFSTTWTTVCQRKSQTLREQNDIPCPIHDQRVKLFRSQVVQ